MININKIIIHYFGTISLSIDKFIIFFAVENKVYKFTSSKSWAP